MSETPKSEMKARLDAAVKEAMRAKEKERLTTIRFLLAAVKQVEVDERIELDDARVLAILDKQYKQRKESSAQYRDNDRADLAEKEEAEMKIIQEFLPEALGEEEIAAAVDAAIAEAGAETMRDMGKVMGILKPQLAGRADMPTVSAQVKARLSG